MGGREWENCCDEEEREGCVWYSCCSELMVGVGGRGGGRSIRWATAGGGREGGLKYVISFLFNRKGRGKKRWLWEVVGEEKEEESILGIFRSNNSRVYICELCCELSLGIVMRKMLSHLLSHLFLPHLISPPPPPLLESHTSALRILGLRRPVSSCLDTGSVCVTFISISSSAVYFVNLEWSNKRRDRDRGRRRRRGKWWLSCEPA